MIDIMANKKLRSCNLDELKEKIIHFYFDIGGCFGGYKGIDIIKIDEKILCVCNGHKRNYGHKRKKLNFFK